MPSEDGQYVVGVACEDLIEGCCQKADSYPSHTSLFEGLRIHEHSNSSNNNSNDNLQSLLSRTPVAGNRSSLASSFGQVPVGESLTGAAPFPGRRADSSLDAEGARIEEANTPSLRRERPLRAREKRWGWKVRIELAQVTLLCPAVLCNFNFGLTLTTIAT